MGSDGLHESKGHHGRCSVSSLAAGDPRKAPHAGELMSEDGVGANWEESENGGASWEDSA